MTSLVDRVLAPSVPAPAEFLAGWDHLELWVGNARALSHLLISSFGFRCAAYSGPETGRNDSVSYLLEQDQIRLVVTAALHGNGEIAHHVRRHGDGVRTIGFMTDDVDAAFSSALLRGATGAVEPVDACDDHGTVRRASVSTYGSTLLAFTDRSAYEGCFEPGFSTRDVLHDFDDGPVGLHAVDHVVGNVEQGRLDTWVEWFRGVLGFAEMRHFEADQISTEFSALRSTVMWNGRDLVLPLNEPADGRHRSQIQEFLDFYDEPGVQHIALRTADIVTAVDEMRHRGIGFLAPPPSYYEEAKRRCGDIDVPWADLARLGVLVDVDAGGYLLQVFTETLGDRPTLFFEVIERRGATGFGEGNFKALFEAIEHEQERRGNL
jgi:4-hydroxyphenylpyruvate dioxygenase